MTKDMNSDRHVAEPDLEAESEELLPMPSLAPERCLIGVEKAEVTYLRNVAGALNAYVYGLNSSLQNSGGIEVDLADIISDLETILRNGEKHG